MKSKQFSFNNNTSLDINLSWCYPGSFNLVTRGTSLFSRVKNDIVRVEFSSGFWICNTPVTVKLWNAVLGNHPRNRWIDMAGENLPVYGIDFREINLFLNELNRLMQDQDIVFSLPNYLEYQYACEARTNIKEPKYWNNENFDSYAWFKENSHGRVREVATRLPNPWGIYDMYGNIFEACIDVETEMVVDTIIDPVSVESDRSYTVIGGCFSSTFKDCQVSHRYGITPENSFVEPLGIRLVCKEGNPNE